MRVEFQSGKVLDLDDKGQGRSPDTDDRFTVSLLGFADMVTPDTADYPQAFHPPRFYHLINGVLEGSVLPDALKGMYAQFVSHDGEGSMFGWADPVIVVTL